MNLTPHNHKLIRTTISKDNELSHAVLDLAAGSQKEWTPATWQALLDTLDASELTIGDLLA